MDDAFHRRRDDDIIQQCAPSPLGLSPDFKLQLPPEPVYEPVYEPPVFDETAAMIDNGIQMNPDDFDQEKLFFDLFNDDEELNKQKSAVAQKPAKDLHGTVPNTDCPAAQQQYVDQSASTSFRGKGKTSYASYSGSQRQSPYSRPMASDAVPNPCQTQLPNPCSDLSQYNIEFDFEDIYGQSPNVPQMLDNSIHQSIDASDGSILVSEPVVAPPAETVDVNAEVIIQCPLTKNQYSIGMRTLSMALEQHGKQINQPEPPKKSKHEIDNLVQKFCSTRDLNFMKRGDAQDIINSGYQEVTNIPLKGKSTSGDFKCLICPILQGHDRGFTRKEDLKRHYHLHFKFARFTCKHCQYGNSRTDHMKLHIQKCHPDKNENDFNR
jgi:hypothetical protein